MSNVLNRLHELEIVARKIVLTVEHLRSENARLKKENASLKGENNLLDEKTGVVASEEVDKINDEWKKDVSNEIDTCLSEIDHCLELLNK